MPWSRSFSMAKMHGNIIRSPVASFCGDFMMACSASPALKPQTTYMHPRLPGDKVRYFEWMGAAAYTADHRAGAMHGKQFLLDSVYAGIDSTQLYGRLDFKDKVPETDFELVVNAESWAR